MFFSWHLYLNWSNVRECTYATHIRRRPSVETRAQKSAKGYRLSQRQRWPSENGKMKSWPLKKGGSGLHAMVRLGPAKPSVVAPRRNMWNDEKIQI